MVNIDCYSQLAVTSSISFYLLKLYRGSQLKKKKGDFKKDLECHNIILKYPGFIRNISHCTNNQEDLKINLRRQQMTTK